jgi:hypothetical protein
MNPSPPPHLVPVLFPGALSESDQEPLLGEQIRYRDAKNEVKECSVEDCVISRLRGKYYIITYGEEVEEVSEREMREMLKNRVE